MNYKKNSILFFFIKGIVKPIYQKFTKIKGKNNKIVKKSFIEKLDAHISGNNNAVVFEDNSTLNNIKIFIAGSNNRITISQNCTIKTVILWIEDNNCEIFVGENTTIESADLSVSEDNSKILIGNDCMLSSKIKIMTGDSHSIIDTNSNKRINYAKNVIIGDHVWIGAEVIILKGSELGDNCIIGTRSLVTKSFESGKLLAGSPARIIKNDINWDRQRI